jgi:hypothetical protein
MRFGKKLAIAMERLEKPFLRQKEIKTKLIGLEKISKALSEQKRLLCEGCDAKAVELFVCLERSKCGVEGDGILLSEKDLAAMDLALMSLIDSDVNSLSQYIKSSEKAISCGFNEWLKEATELGILLKVGSYSSQVELDILQFALNRRSQKDSTFPSIVEFLLKKFEETASELSRLVEYTELNIEAFRKLLRRREKHVSVPYTKHLELSTALTGELVLVSAMIKSVLVDLVEKIEFNS